MRSGAWTFTVRKRPRWLLILALPWLLLLATLAQTALASLWEEERRAAILSGTLALGVLVVGGLFWHRLGRPGRADREEPPPGNP